VSFATITLCVASKHVFVVVYFVMTQSGNFWIHPRTCSSSSRSDSHILPIMSYVFLKWRRFLDALSLYFFIGTWKPKTGFRELYVRVCAFVCVCMNKFVSSHDSPKM
jgi:hypothetical protein